MTEAGYWRGALLRRTHGPERAELVDQPLTRRRTSQLNDLPVRERGGRSVAAKRDFLDRHVAELRCVTPRGRPAALAGRPAYPLAVHLPADGPARVVVAGLSARAEQPRPVVGGLGDPHPRPWRRQRPR